KTGMNAYQSKMDAISNNLANSTTTGYKSVDVAFKDLMSESLNRQGYKTNKENMVIGTGTRSVDVSRNQTQGSLRNTELSTDIALDGLGYFKVISANGNEAYTRDGGFKIDGYGKLVDSFGNKLNVEYAEGYSENNVILTSENFSISKHGDLYVKMGQNYTKVGEIPVYNAIGDGSFASIGENLFVPTEGAVVERTTDTDMYQGFLEMSNVDMGSQMSDLIVAQRAYQMAGKGITTSDEMWKMINNIR
nr:flagellar basal body rod protein FlgG [Clostridium sp.]